MNRRGEWGQNLPPKLTIEGQEDRREGPDVGSKRHSKEAQGGSQNKRRKGEPEVEGQVKTANMSRITPQETKTNMETPRNNIKSYFSQISNPSSQNIQTV